LPVIGFRGEFTLIDRIPQLRSKLIIHGDKDDIIPIELGRQVSRRQATQILLRHSRR
jgi:hypothetical protein